MNEMRQTHSRDLAGPDRATITTTNTTTAATAKTTATAYAES